MALTFYFYIISMPGLCAQQTGLLLDRAAYDSLPNLSPLGMAKSEQLPAKVDLSTYCPMIRNQGKLQSCVGWALGYGLLSMNHAIASGWNDTQFITDQAFSALYVYNQLRSDCKAQIRFEQAFALLKQQGNCSFFEFDAKIGLDNCETQPDQTLLTNARKNRAYQFEKVFNSDDAYDLKVKKVRSMLAENRPVLVGIRISKDFITMPQGRKVYLHDPGAKIEDGHAMVVVGYDDNLRAFRLFNSWGTDWADHGFVWMKYEDFGLLCSQAYIQHKPRVVPQTVPSASPVVVNTLPAATTGGNSNNHFTANVQLQAIDPNNEYAATTVQLQGQKGIYKPKRAAWPIEQMFQLKIVNPSRDIHLYAFSIDPSFNNKIHWPRNALLAKEVFAELNESPFLRASNHPLTIPGEDIVLTLESPGIDVLYVLFSTQALPLRDLQVVMENVRNYKSNYAQHLKEVLGQYLMPDDAVIYDPNRMSFMTQLDTTKPTIVPMVLEVKIN